MTYLRTFLLNSVQTNIMIALIIDVLIQKKKQSRPQVMRELRLIKLITEGKYNAPVYIRQSSG